ncbi:MAG: hypothetical protein U9Q04_10120 [Campylobacterota bacterium]|nr:hypothetical protein [Campylobacterota bacterium]
MSNNNGMILKEGYFQLTIGVIATLILSTICSLASFVALIYTLFIVYIFRNPNRNIFKNSSNILSPVDGTVEAIDHKSGKTKIYINISLCDQHTLRSPIDTELKITKVQNGLNLDPYTFKGSKLNEQIKFKFNDKLKLKLIGGFFNSAFSYTKKHNIEQGEPIAIITNGLAILTIDNSYDLKIKLSDKLISGQTLIA